MKKKLALIIAMSITISMLGLFNISYADSSEDIMLEQIKSEYCNKKLSRDERISSIRNCTLVVLRLDSKHYFSVQGMRNGKCYYEKRINEDNFHSRKIANCSAPLSVFQSIADFNSWYIKTMCELSTAKKYKETMATQAKNYRKLTEIIKPLDSYCTPI